MSCPCWLSSPFAHALADCPPAAASGPCRRQLNLSRTFRAEELEHVLSYSDGKDGLLADIHIVSAALQLA